MDGGGGGRHELVDQCAAAVRERDRLRLRVDELLAANSREVERRRDAENRLAGTEEKIAALIRRIELIERAAIARGRVDIHG